MSQDPASAPNMHAMQTVLLIPFETTTCVVLASQLLALTADATVPLEANSQTTHKTIALSQCINEPEVAEKIMETRWLWASSHTGLVGFCVPALLQWAHISTTDFFRLPKTLQNQKVQPCASWIRGLARLNDDETGLAHTVGVVIDLCELSNGLDPS